MFRFAKLYNVYHYPLVVAVRFFVLLVVLIMLAFSIYQDTSARLPIGLLLLFAMTELFVNGKFHTLRPKKTVQEGQAAQLLETFTLPAASALLKVKNSHPLLQTLLGKKEVQFVLKRAAFGASEIVEENVDPDELSILAFRLAKEEEKAYVTILDLFGAYLLLTEKKTKLLFQKELKKEDLLTLIAFAQTVFPQELTVFLPKVTPWGGGIGESWVSGWTLETQKYTQDFTRRCLANPPISVGREKESALLIESLLKSKKSNALLIGEPGVGKKEIVASFVTQSFLGNLPRGLRFLRVLELLSGSLVAGASSSGELEERLSNILSETTHSGDIVLFIPELQNIAGAGSDGLDVTGVLLPHLLDDKVRVVATVTPQSYKAFFEKKAEFLDAFEKITVEEPTKEKAVPMLLDASLLLERKHKAIFTYKAVVAAIDLSEKYMPGRFLPGKAIALLDELAAKARLLGKLIIDKEDVVTLLEEKLPIKVEKPKGEEKELLLNLEDILHTRIIDQEEAVKTVSEAMRRLRSGLAFEGRPVGVFLFLGPTGVGKTETAKALSSVYFGSEDSMLRFDMSEYQDRSSADRLVGELTEKVRAHPFSLILLDEFEKAYYSLLDVFLGIFEDGRLTDLSGRTVSFDNTIIIATSNAGAEVIREGIQESVTLHALKPKLLDTLQRDGVFKPELLNRFDAIVLFEPLGEEEIAQVTKLLLEKVASVLGKKDITFTFDKKAIAKIALGGFDQTMGARPLRRFIQDHVENLLSQKLLRDEAKRGDTIVLSTDNANNLTLITKIL